LFAVVSILFAPASYGLDIAKENPARLNETYNENHWAYPAIRWGLDNRIEDVVTNRILSRKEAAMYLRRTFDLLFSTSTKGWEQYAERMNKIEEWLVTTGAHMPATREDTIFAVTSIIYDEKETGTDLKRIFKDAHKVKPEFVKHVEFAAANKLVVGYDDNTLRPDGELSLVEALVFLERLSNFKVAGISDNNLIKKEKEDNSFVKNLYYKYKDGFYKEGIDFNKPIPKKTWFNMVKDFTSNLVFRGADKEKDYKDYWIEQYTMGANEEEYIKREDAIGGLIKILSMFKDIKMSGDYKDIELLKQNFTDVDEISDRQLSLIAIAYRDDIIGFHENKIRPKDYLTYGEALADLIHDAFEVEGKAVN